MRIPHLGAAIVCFSCAGLLSGEAVQITTTPSHTHTPTPTITPTPTSTPVRPTPWVAGTGEIAVNASTSGDQRAPSLGRGADFGFVAAWASDGQDGDGAGVFVQRFDRAGAPSGAEIQVNNVTTGDQDQPSIGADGSGAFVIAWSSGPVGDRDVRARRYDADGNPIGGEFLVNSYSTGDQHSPVVGKHVNGFVVVWTSDGQDGDAGGTYGQAFSVNGVPDGTEFRINETTTGDQRTPRLANDFDGNFVVVWNSVGQDGDQGGIFGRIYNPAAGSELPVNDVTTDAQTDPDVLYYGNNSSFVVAWSSPDGEGHGIFARAFNSFPGPIPVGSQFRVNASTAGHQSAPRVGGQFSWMPSPGFLITWQSEGQDDPEEPPATGIFAQRFDNAPSPTAQFYLTQQPPRRGSEYQVNTLTTGSQSRPDIVHLGEVGFVVAWDSADQDGSGSGVVARKFNAPGGVFMTVDTVPSGGASNLNGVLESGERVIVAPAWNNEAQLPGLPPLPLTGAASGLTGPIGPAYTLDDMAADYGSIPIFHTQDCVEAGGNCYEMTVTGDRPAAHWDATFDESLGSTDPIGPMKKTWSLHVGGSFPDVPADPFYPYIENIFHNGITGGGGCGVGLYCGDDGVLRQQMAVFLVKASRGSTFVPPPATGTVFDDVPADSPFAPWIEELARAGITGGCSAPPPPALPSFCPTATVNRQQMAAFLGKAYYGSSFSGWNCVGMFDDVPCSNLFAPYIEYLAGTQIAAGCQASPPLYCPTNPTLRKQMAVFLVKTFGLQLYGPD